MAKRKSKKDSTPLVVDKPMDVPAEVVAGLDGLAETFAASAPQDLADRPMLPEPGAAPSVEPTAEPVPTAKSVEERIAALEAVFKAELAERDRLIVRQAAQLDVAADNAERLRASLEHVEELEDEMEDAKKAAAEAKKKYDAAVKTHFELQRDLDSPQQKLPFTATLDEPKPAPAKLEAPPVAPEPVAAPAEPTSSPAEPFAASDEEWRSVPLGKLGIANELPPSIVAKLAEAGLTNMGQLADWVKPDQSGRCKSITDIPGLGKAKAQKIEDASIAFWELRSLDSVDVNAELVAGVAEAEAEAEAIQSQRELEATEPDSDQADGDGDEAEAEAEAEADETEAA